MERVVRSLGLRKIVDRFVPVRAGDYSSSVICDQVVAGLLCGGKGFQAAETLRRDSLLARIFGHEKVAEESTVWRACCDMAGLEQRSFAKTYKPVGAVQPALDLQGNEKKPAAYQRIVAAAPEAMPCERRAQFDALLEQVAVRCAQALPNQEMKLAGFVTVHGDGTALEVRGSCFDAARKDRNGNQSLQLMTLTAGPVYVGFRLLPGASDEGEALAALLATSGKTVAKIAPRAPVLSLLDAAFAEKDVVEQIHGLDWRYIICANQYRNCLERLAADIVPQEWTTTGADTRRGWADSAVALMRHQPEGWSAVQTVVVRRWRNNDELEGTWNYSFLYTDLTSQMLPKKKIKQYGFAAFVWMMYATKQGRENTYKTWLTDLGGHHPASGRLGASEVMCCLQAIAANVHAVISQRVVAKEERGIRHWRFVRDYIRLAGRVVMKAGRTLMVRLAGADVPENIRQLWLQAYAVSARL
ncbi:MAG: transposase [Acidobacteria bacterium]|nr:transposase [Acidobacteriota bacterium]